MYSIYYILYSIFYILSLYFFSLPYKTNFFLPAQTLNFFNIKFRFKGYFLPVNFQQYYFNHLNELPSFLFPTFYQFRGSTFYNNRN